MNEEQAAWAQFCREQEASNRKLLAEFAEWLTTQGMKREQTIQNHVFNVGYYINEYLMLNEGCDPAEGAAGILDFFSSWFIRNTPWASEKSMRRTAASVRHFYKFMKETGRIDWRGYEFVRGFINCEMDEWVELLEMWKQGGGKGAR